jgi:hypothetical protein
MNESRKKSASGSKEAGWEILAEQHFYKMRIVLWA